MHRYSRPAFHGCRETRGTGLVVSNNAVANFVAHEDWWGGLRWHRQEVRSSHGNSRLQVAALQGPSPSSLTGWWPSSVWVLLQPTLPPDIKRRCIRTRGVNVFFRPRRWRCMPRFFEGCVRRDSLWIDTARRARVRGNAPSCESVFAHAALVASLAGWCAYSQTSRSRINSIGPMGLLAIIAAVAAVSSGVFTVRLRT